MANPTTEAQVRQQTVRSGSTVFVACKFPTGIKMDLTTPRDETEMTPSGPRTIKVNRRTGESFTARGPQLPFGKAPTFPIIAGYAITAGVPKEFWDKYAEQNEQADYIVNHVLMAAETMDKLSSLCRQYGKSTQSGFQPLDMVTRDKKGQIADPRVPRSLPGTGITAIGTAEEAPNKPVEMVPVEE